MTYKIKIIGNTRAIITISIILLLLAGAFILLLKVPGNGGIISGLISIGLAALVFKAFYSQIKSVIHTDDTGISCKMNNTGNIQIKWNQITHCGLARHKHNNMLYLYWEDKDQLLTIPDTFNNFPTLTEEISNCRNYLVQDLNGRSEIVEYLKTQLADSNSETGD